MNCMGVVLCLVTTSGACQYLYNVLYSTIYMRCEVRIICAVRKLVEWCKLQELSINKESQPGKGVFFAFAVMPKMSVPIAAWCRLRVVP